MSLLLVSSADSSPFRFHVSHISSCSESEEWSTISNRSLSPQIEVPKDSDCDSDGDSDGDSDSDSDSDSLVYDVMCRVNGLLCLSCSSCYVEDFVEYVFWNPSTDKFQFIPLPDSTFLPCTCSSTQCIKRVMTNACGLGFVAESQDCKFVRFMTNFSNADFTEHAVTEHVAVYSTKNDSWKELPFPSEFHPKYFQEVISICPVYGGVATCVDGFCYWIISSRDAILSFDLSTDEFSTLPYPDDIERDDFSIERDVFLMELDGSLCLVIQFQLDSETATKLFSFWVYESSSISWTRKFDLDVRLAAKKPLWLGNKKNNSLVLLLQEFDGSLLEYNYTTIELKKIDQIQDGHPNRMMMISPYVDLRYVETENDDNDGVDRVSQLPDDIIVSILSLLSLEEASFTSLLSTRWRDLWRHILNLVFPNADNDLIRGKDMYTKFVNSVVESHKAPCFKEFNISLPLNNSIRRRTLTKWLELAFSRGVEVLVLNLAGTRFGFLEKSFLLKSTNLTSLSLKCMKVSGQSIRLVLRSCPLLELLIIKYAVLKSDLEICGSVLKHLDIQYCEGGKSIKGYAPNLTYLRFDSGRYLCWGCGDRCAVDHPLIRITSSTLTTLVFTLQSPEYFLKIGFPQMPTLRKLIVTHFDCGCSTLHPIASLLRAFPYLEEFEIKQQRYYSYSMKRGAETMNNVERLCHRHLRVFKFTCFEVGDGDHMELMSYILDNCAALQKIILHNYGCYSSSRVGDWEYVKQLQSKLPSNIQLITS